MGTQVQFRRGTTSEHSAFTGAVGEVTVDTDKDVVVVHDGVVAGGVPGMRQDGANSALALGTAASPSLKFTGDINTGLYSPGADQVAISTGGTGRVFVDASGRVGIGTAGPGQSLDVVNGTARVRTGAKSGSNAYLKLESSDASDTMELRFSNSTNANWQIQSIENGVSYRPLALNPDGGNVGIGTASAAGRLTVAGNTISPYASLTDAATVTVDLSLSNNFQVTLGGNQVLGAPTNVTAGQSGVIRVVQDATGGRTLSYNTTWKFAGGTIPTLTTTANAIDLLAYHVESATRIAVRFVGDVK
jgi:hypothetical protein